MPWSIQILKIPHLAYKKKQCLCSSTQRCKGDIPEIPHLSDVLLLKESPHSKIARRNYLVFIK